MNECLMDSNLKRQKDFNAVYCELTYDLLLKNQLQLILIFFLELEKVKFFFWDISGWFVKLSYNSVYRGFNKNWDTHNKSGVDGSNPWLVENLNRNEI